MLQSFTPLPVSAQIALEPTANLSREKTGGDVNCKFARMTRPEPTTPAEEPRAEPSANQEAWCKILSYLLKPVVRPIACSSDHSNWAIASSRKYNAVLEQHFSA